MTQILKKDVWQVIYDYCDVKSLESLITTSKRNYQYADDRYYEKRMKMFFGFCKAELEVIIAKIIDDHAKTMSRNNQIDEDYFMELHYHSTVKKLLLDGKLLRNLEKKLVFFYNLFNSIRESEDNSDDDSDESDNSHEEGNKSDEKGDEKSNWILRIKLLNII